MLAEKWSCESQSFAEHSPVSKGFSAAAKTYSSHNVVQTICSSELIEGLNLQGNIVDLGAGPGTQYHVNPASSVLCLDVAFGMLSFLKSKFPSYSPINADAQSLPLLSESIDYIVSNLALQWCSDYKSAIDEAQRVLTHGGEIHLNLVANNSLPELKALGFSVNQFRELSEYQQAFETSNWKVLEVELSKKVVYFSTLKELLYSIKGVGASVKFQNSDSQVQIRGRKDWDKLIKLSKQQTTKRGLPLTYEIVRIRAKKIG
ncbi:methyltransferase domain-containing protein [Parashewanella spongiae]|nr:methyltransferase domain-containing protein [Parashewanella spongiae]MCL1076722.1 methyltransferase domain-containing protein [Parashewanella spongiae]